MRYMTEVDRPLRADVGREALERAALLLARTLVDRTRSLYRELEQRTGAPVQAHRALACVAAKPGIQSSQLAAAMGMQRPAVSQLLRSLVASGWMERRRDVQDQRTVHLFVTAAGRSIVAATAGRMVGVLQRAVSRLNDVQLQELERSLSALLEHVESPAPVGLRTSSKQRHPRARK